MNRFKFFLAFFLVAVLILFISISFKFSLNKIITNDDLYKTAVISVSLRDAETGNIIYEKNGNLLLHPASTLKVFTSAVVLNHLGHDYRIKTSLYRENKNLYLKLSGDPLLTTSELHEIFRETNKNIKYKVLIIDDTAIDNIQWGVGWMWDDQNNPLMPKFSAYNLDHNLIKIGDDFLPVENPREYFLSKLNFKGQVKTGKIQSLALISEKSRNIKEVIDKINKNSDNLASEMLLKLAGGGTTEGGLKVFTEFYESLGVDTSSLFIVDASGVSHNDLIQTNWMTLALSKLYNNPNFKDYRYTLAMPGEKNTINGRFNNLSGRLWVKTGTLSGISGLTGYIQSKSGKMYCFAILIQNYKGDSKMAKQLEDKILNALESYTDLQLISFRT